MEVMRERTNRNTGREFAVSYRPRPPRLNYVYDVVIPYSIDAIRGYLLAISRHYSVYFHYLKAVVLQWCAKEARFDQQTRIKQL
jgi:hypothetical protein